MSYLQHGFAFVRRIMFIYHPIQNKNKCERPRDVAPCYRCDRTNSEYVSEGERIRLKKEVGYMEMLLHPKKGKLTF